MTPHKAIRERMTAEEFDRIRRNSRLSEEEFSRLLGISRYLVRCYASGKKTVPKELISRLYDTLPAETLLRPSDSGDAGARLKELRESLGHTQSSLADALGIATSNLSVVEAGAKQLNPILAHRICAFTSADFCYLMYGAKP